MQTPFTLLDNSIKEFSDARNLLVTSDKLKSQILQLGEDCASTISAGGKIIFAGNGGSFADAIHISAEFTATMGVKRIPLSSIVLGTNLSYLTAVGNDYNFEIIFARELEAIAKSDDFVIPISTSGNSKNLINLADIINVRGLKSTALLGKDGGELAKLLPSIIVPVNRTERIQEIHIFIGHVICEITELKLGFR
jgi:D-sedoheptulose 7-phosphate isomerase